MTETTTKQTQTPVRCSSTRAVIISLFVECAVLGFKNVKNNGLDGFSASVVGACGVFYNVCVRVLQFRLLEFVCLEVFD